MTVSVKETLKKKGSKPRVRGQNLQCFATGSEWKRDTTPRLIYGPRWDAVILPGQIAGPHFLATRVKGRQGHLVLPACIAHVIDCFCRPCAYQACTSRAQSSRPSGLAQAGSFPSRPRFKIHGVAHDKRAWSGKEVWGGALQTGNNGRSPHHDNKVPCGRRRLQGSNLPFPARSGSWRAAQALRRRQRTAATSMIGT